MLNSPRAAIVLVFAAFGFLVGAQVGALPVIVKLAAVDQQLFGYTQGLNMMVALAAMMMGGYLSRMVDHRVMILVSLPACFLALIGSLTSHTPFTYVIAFITFGGMLSFLDLNMNAEGAAIEEDVKRPIFTMFHAAVSLGMAAMSIVSSYLSVTYGPLMSALLAGLVVIWAMVEVWQLVPARSLHLVESGSSSRLPLAKLFLVGMTIGFSNACEISAMLWAGQLLAQIKPELIAYSGLGAAFFGGCGGVMRIFGDGLRTRFGEIPFMAVGLAVAICGFAVLSLAPGFAFSVVAFAAVGAGLAPIFPGLYAMAGRLAPQRRAAAMGLTSAMSGVPRFVVPMVLGVLSSWYGLSAVYMCSTVLSALSLGLLVFALGPIEKGASLR
jgi:predicted MFS family arabinose efflux permease